MAGRPSGTFSNYYQKRLYDHCSTRWRGAKVEGTKSGGEKEQPKPPCTSGPESKGVSLYDDPSRDQGCESAEVDQEWEMAEALPPHGPRVVVVGAGPAGLTAADRLLAAGVKDIAILESTSRAGGRLLSRWAGDTVVELGLTRSPRRPLSWAHPLFKSAGVGPPIGTDPTAGLLDLPLSLSALLRAQHLFQGLQSEEHCANNISGYRGVRVEQTGRTMPVEEREEVARAMTAIGALLGPRRKVVEDGFCPYVLAPGGTQVPFGECRTLLPLIRRLGCGRIHFRKEVVAIRWGTVTPEQRPRAVVRCRDGSEYPAEFVLVTFSLGCLKHNLEGIFCPSLPPSKHAAIGKTAFHPENTAFLVFDEPIWSWSTKPVDFAFNIPPKSASRRKGDWTAGVVEMRQEEGSERVVRVRLVGQDAVHMERATDSAALEHLHRFLQDKLGLGDIPKPKTIIRSRWCDCRHTLGLRAGHGAEDELAAPLPTADHFPPVLLFAGEATSPRGGLEGALLSGLREAERLIEILGRLPKQYSREICPKICKSHL